MRGERFFPLLVVAAGLLAYHNSFTGEFIRDDVQSILNNPTIRCLWPIWQPLSPPQRGGLTVEGRPFINLSLAINYALSGYSVWGYHALNLIVHILAGLTLFGIVRRTLLQPALRERFGAAASELALATAVLWTVHPLQTESVTYVIQRAESIMGLFYLLTLYCFIRGVGSVQPRLWYSACLGACALGMASKEVMITAPLMVLLYDRAFLSVSFREAWQRRRRLYLGLSATWILLGYLSILTIRNALTNAERIGLTWWQYLATEPGVILYYLRLSVWPDPLYFDFYAWPIAKTWISILPPAVVVVTLLGASTWVWRKNPAWGFVGAWFFLILAPSSSVVPSHDAIFEHRMYLSLAAVVCVAVMGLYSMAGQRSLAVFVVVAVGLGFLTWRRNWDYRNDIALRMNAVAKAPHNALARYGLAIALQDTGRLPEAVDQYEQILQVAPDDAKAHYNLGLALAGLGRPQEAVEHYQQALRIRPDYEDAHNNLGLALVGLGRLPDAIAHYEQALRIKPDDARAYCNLGNVLLETGRIDEALGHYEQALRISPDFAEAHYCLGVALEREGRVQEAMVHYERAARIKPDLHEAQNNLGNALLAAGQTTEAIGRYEQALRVRPDSAETQFNLAVALEKAGRVPEAVARYEQVLRINPGMAEAQKALARLRSVQ